MTESYSGVKDNVQVHFFVGGEKGKLILIVDYLSCKSNMGEPEEHELVEMLKHSGEIQAPYRGFIEDRNGELSAKLKKYSDQEITPLEDDRQTTSETQKAPYRGFIKDRNGQLSAELNKYSRFQVKGDNPELCNAIKNLFKSPRREVDCNAEIVVVVTMYVTRVEIDALEALGNAGIKPEDKARTILVMVHQANENVDFVTYTSDRVSQTFHVQWKPTNVLYIVVQTLSVISRSTIHRIINILRTCTILKKSSPGF